MSFIYTSDTQPCDTTHYTYSSLLGEQNQFKPVNLQSEMTEKEKREEKALDDYFALLDKYPHLKRKGFLNDHTKGAIETIYDRDRIKAIHKKEGGGENIMPGLIQAKFWYILRHTVKFPPSSKCPDGFEGTYDVITWRCSLEQQNNDGAAVMPILNADAQSPTDRKIAFILNYRYALGQWALEIIRGGALKEKKETAQETAIRELEEEAGYICHDIKSVGTMSPDSGVTSAVVNVFIAFVKENEKKEAQPEKTESIGGVHLISEAELDKMLAESSSNSQFLTLKVQGEEQQVYFGDPFFSHAYLRYKLSQNR